MTDDLYNRNNNKNKSSDFKLPFYYICIYFFRVLNWLSSARKTLNLLAPFWYRNWFKDKYIFFMLLLLFFLFRCSLVVLIFVNASLLPLVDLCCVHENIFYVENLLLLVWKIYITVLTFNFVYDECYQESSSHLFSISFSLLHNINLIFYIFIYIFSAVFFYFCCHFAVVNT